jgi:hypothetical protein
VISIDIMGAVPVRIRPQAARKRPVFMYFAAASVDHRGPPQSQPFVTRAFRAITPPARFSGGRAVGATGSKTAANGGVGEPLLIKAMIREIPIARLRSATARTRPWRCRTEKAEQGPKTWTSTRRSVSR